MARDKLEEKLTRHCLNAQYGVPDKKTFKIKDTPASNVIALVGGKPRLHFDQV